VNYCKNGNPNVDDERLAFSAIKKLFLRDLLINNNILSEIMLQNIASF
jgi:hypothetical protein